MTLAAIEAINIINRLAGSSVRDRLDRPAVLRRVRQVSNNQHTIDTVKQLLQETKDERD